MLFVSLVALCALPSAQTSASIERKEGWIVLHVSGSPRDIGYHYGKLLSTEIADAHKCVKWALKQTTKKDWEFYRETAKRLHWDNLPIELKSEIDGQVEGLNEVGVHFDRWDVLAFNDFIEISENYLPWTKGEASEARESCSAFVACGSYTEDGGIVVAQSLWWDYIVGSRFNLVLDIKPTNGHRIVMDALCGFVHSGTDFAISDAGLALCETTLPPLKTYNPKGIAEFARMRRAIQYGDSTDSMAKILKEQNSGGYANTWLMADIHKKEIARLELGLNNVTFEKTADGFFVGSNFAQGSSLIDTEVAGAYDSSPSTSGPECRRLRLSELLNAGKGSIDINTAKRILSDSVDATNPDAGISLRTICGRSDTDLWGVMNAKVTDSSLIKSLQFWGKMGFTNDSTLEVGPFLRNYPQYSNCRSVLQAIPKRNWILLGQR